MRTTVEKLLVEQQRRRQQQAACNRSNQHCRWSNRMLIALWRTQSQKTRSANEVTHCCWNSSRKSWKNWKKAKWASWTWSPLRSVRRQCRTLLWTEVAVAVVVRARSRRKTGQTVTANSSNSSLCMDTATWSERETSEAWDTGFTSRGG